MAYKQPGGNHRVFSIECTLQCEPPHVGCRFQKVRWGLGWEWGEAQEMGDVRLGEGGV